MEWNCTCSGHLDRKPSAAFRQQFSVLWAIICHGRPTSASQGRDAGDHLLMLTGPLELDVTGEQ